MKLRVLECLVKMQKEQFKNKKNRLKKFKREEQKKGFINNWKNLRCSKKRIRNDGKKFNLNMRISLPKLSKYYQVIKINWKILNSTFRIS